MSDIKVLDDLFRNGTHEEMRHVLYDIIVQHLSLEETQQRLVQRTRNRMQWNYLPNDLWIQCWNYLTQYEYRCAAIHLNQQCLKLSRTTNCRPRSYVSIKSKDIQFPEYLLLNLSQPIVSLEVHAQCLKKYQPLPHVESLTFLSGKITFEQMVKQLNHMPKLTKLCWDVTDYRMTDLHNELSQAVFQLQELDVRGLNKQIFHSDWTKWFIYLSQLQILHLEHLWCFDLQVLHTVSIHLSELYMNACSHQHARDSSPVFKRFPKLQVLELVGAFSAGMDFQPFRPVVVLRALCEHEELRSLKLSHWTISDIQHFSTLSLLTRSIRDMFVALDHDSESLLYASIYSAFFTLVHQCKQLETLQVIFTDHKCFDHVETESMICTQMIQQQVEMTAGVVTSIISNDNRINVNFKELYVTFGTRTVPKIVANFICMFESCCNLQFVQLRFDSKDQVVRAEWFSQAFQDCFITRQSQKYQGIYGGWFKPEKKYKLQFFYLLHQIQLEHRLIEYSE